MCDHELVKYRHFSTRLHLTTCSIGLLPSRNWQKYRKISYISICANIIGFKALPTSCFTILENLDSFNADKIIKRNKITLNSAFPLYTKYFFYSFLDSDIIDYRRAFLISSYFADVNSLIEIKRKSIGVGG